MIKRTFDFIDNRSVVRRIGFFSTLFLTWFAFDWARDFADHTARSGIEVAAIIAAVTAPITALQGYIFKSYTETRSEK